MKTICPNCYQKYEVTEDYLQKEITCTECEHVFCVDKAKFCSNCGAANPSQDVKCWKCHTAFKVAPNKDTTGNVNQGIDVIKWTVIFVLAAVIGVAIVLCGPYGASGQFELAERYSKEGKPQKAIQWLKKAAEQGHAKAQLKLDLMYRKSEGVGQDRDKAPWMEAAAQGARKDRHMLLQKLREERLMNRTVPLSKIGIDALGAIQHESNRRTELSTAQQNSHEEVERSKAFDRYTKDTITKLKERYEK